MGFFDSIKKATGLGLNAVEHYDRAFEKAVLLGPQKYGEAVGLFDAAARKAAEAGDAQLEARARANGALYAFVTSGRQEHLEALFQLLPQVPELEQVGSRTEVMATDILLREVEARLTEARVAAVDARDVTARSDAHLAAAAAFKAIFTAPLLTYRYHAPDRHVETAQSRYFLHQGHSAWNLALRAAMTNPDGAAEQMARAMNFFQQCGDDDWTTRSRVWLEKCRKRRTCYVCHREVQGEGLHFGVYDAHVSPYVLGIVKGLGQDVSSVDVECGTVVMCEPCGTAVQNIADAVAQRRTQELRDEVNQRLGEVAGAINELQNAVVSLSHRVAAVERVAHRH